MFHQGDRRIANPDKHKKARSFCRATFTFARVQCEFALVPNGKYIMVNGKWVTSFWGNRVPQWSNNLANLPPKTAPNLTWKPNIINSGTDSFWVGQHKECCWNIAVYGKDHQFFFWTPNMCTPFTSGLQIIDPNHCYILSRGYNVYNAHLYTIPNLVQVVLHAFPKINSKFAHEIANVNIHAYDINI